MKTFTININFQDSTYLSFNDVKSQDVSEIVRLLSIYCDINTITINKNY